MNPADLNDAFANYSSVVLGEVGSSLEDFQSDIMDIITENEDRNREYIDDVKAGNRAAARDRPPDRRKEK